MGAQAVGFGVISDQLLTLARSTRGFMPDDEGLALVEAAESVIVDGPFVEIGSYCGKSAVYLGAVAQRQQRLLFAVDHHRGSEENQPGWEYHEPDLVDPDVGLIDTLPYFRSTIRSAELDDTVVAVVGDSHAVGKSWQTPVALLFIDGGHGTEVAHGDYDAWAEHIAVGGSLLIHDVFEDPADGGRPPFEIYQRALRSGDFVEVSATGSFRHLRREDRRGRA